MSNNYLNTDYGNQVASSSASTNSTFLGSDLGGELEKKGSIYSYQSSVSGDSELALTEENNAPEPHMGLPSSINMIIGLIIGSGIFASPGPVTVKVGALGASLIVWAAGGVLSMIGALCYAELGTMITKSGGEYQYLKSAFGSCMSTLFSWCNLLLVNPIGSASIASVFGRYILEMAYFDINDPTGENTVIPDYAVRLTTIGCIWCVVLFNCYGRKAGAWLSNFFTVSKLLALFMIIIIGFVWLGKGGAANFENSFQGASKDPLSYGTAMYMALFSYNGWNNLNYGISEVKNPKRNLPLAIVISCVSVTVIYILANIAYFATLPFETIATSSTVAMQLGVVAMGKGGAYFFALMVVFSTFGAVNANIWAGSRLFMTAANEDSIYVPSLVGKTNEKSGAPMRALIVVGFITTIWSLPGDFTYLATIYCFLNWLFYGITVSALIYMRFKKTTKDLDRPFKIWLPFAIFFVILDVYLVVAPLVDAGSDGVVIYIICILIGLLALPIWFVRVYKPEVGQKLFGWIRGYEDARMVKLQREEQLKEASKEVYNNNEKPQIKLTENVEN